MAGWAHALANAPVSVSRPNEKKSGSKTRVDPMEAFRQLSRDLYAQQAAGAGGVRGGVTVVQPARAVSTVASTNRRPTDPRKQARVDQCGASYGPVGSGVPRPPGTAPVMILSKQRPVDPHATAHTSADVDGRLRADAAEHMRRIDEGIEALRPNDCKAEKTEKAKHQNPLKKRKRNAGYLSEKQIDAIDAAHALARTTPKRPGEKPPMSPEGGYSPTSAAYSPDPVSPTSPSSSYDPKSGGGGESAAGAAAPVGVHGLTSPAHPEDSPTYDPHKEQAEFDAAAKKAEFDEQYASTDVASNPSSVVNTSASTGLDTSVLQREMYEQRARDLNVAEQHARDAKDARKKAEELVQQRTRQLDALWYAAHNISLLRSGQLWRASWTLMFRQAGDDPYIPEYVFASFASVVTALHNTVIFVQAGSDLDKEIRKMSMREYTAINFTCVPYARERQVVVRSVTVDAAMRFSLVDTIVVDVQLFIYAVHIYCTIPFRQIQCKTRESLCRPFYPHGLIAAHSDFRHLPVVEDSVILSSLLSPHGHYLHPEHADAWCKRSDTDTETMTVLEKHIAVELFSFHVVRQYMIGRDGVGRHTDVQIAFQASFLQWCVFDPAHAEVAYKEFNHTLRPLVTWLWKDVKGDIRTLIGEPLAKIARKCTARKLSGYLDDGPEDRGDRHKFQNTFAAIIRAVLNMTRSIWSDSPAVELGEYIAYLDQQRELHVVSGETVPLSTFYQQMESQIGIVESYCSRLFRNAVEQCKVHASWYRDSERRAVRKPGMEDVFVCSPLIVVIFKTEVATPDSVSLSFSRAVNRFLTAKDKKEGVCACFQCVTFSMMSQTGRHMTCLVVSGPVLTYLNVLSALCLRQIVAESDFSELKKSGASDHLIHRRQLLCQITFHDIVVDYAVQLATVEKQTDKVDSRLKMMDSVADSIVKSINSQAKLSHVIFSPRQERHMFKCRLTAKVNGEVDHPYWLALIDRYTQLECSLLHKKRDDIQFAPNLKERVKLSDHVVDGQKVTQLSVDYDTRFKLMTVQGVEDDIPVWSDSSLFIYGLPLHGYTVRPPPDPVPDCHRLLLAYQALRRKSPLSESRLMSVWHGLNRIDDEFEQGAFWGMDREYMRLPAEPLAVPVHMTDEWGDPVPATTTTTTTTTTTKVSASSSGSAGGGGGVADGPINNTTSMAAPRTPAVTAHLRSTEHRATQSMSGVDGGVSVVCDGPITNTTSMAAPGSPVAVTAHLRRATQSMSGVDGEFERCEW